MSHDYILKFIFNDSICSVSNIVLSLVSENNSQALYSGDFYDGHIMDIHSALNFDNWHYITPEKYIYNPKVAPCRMKPYYEELATRVMENIRQRAIKDTNETHGQLCRPLETKYVFDVTKTLPKDWPFCDESDIFSIKRWWEAQSSVRRSIVKRPCTKVQYRAQGSPWTHTNHTAFHLIFAPPPMLIVKEEYLIYDILALIGAVGGTMGICIGVSFADLFRYLFNSIYLSMKRAKQNRRRMLWIFQQSQKVMELTLKEK